MLSLDTSPSQHHDIALYVHWPFCAKKCPYCDFNSHVREGVDQARFKSAFLTELEHVASRLGSRQLTSIFFGGGTPSLMPPDTMAAIIDRATSLWSPSQDIEITMEANPTSIEADKFIDFKAAGVNRVSVGVQSLIDADLIALGREHSAAEAITAIEIAAQAFDRYSFDLIYAREGQTVSAWEDELSNALKHAKGHMSLYQLTIEPGTAFHTRYQRGDLSIPDDEAASTFYTVTQDMMADAGMPAYETSNHAATGQESAHNLTYWRYGEYAGVGPGAHGRIIVDGKRYATRTHLAPEIWCQKVEGEGSGYHKDETLSPRQQAEEWLMMGLRLTKGVNLEDCAAITGCDSADILDQKGLAQMIEGGFIWQEGRAMGTRAKGALCLNGVLGKLLK